MLVRKLSWLNITKMNMLKKSNGIIRRNCIYVHWLEVNLILHNLRPLIVVCLKASKWSVIWKTLKSDVAQKIMWTDGETGENVNKTALIFGLTLQKFFNENWGLTLKWYYCVTMVFRANFGYEDMGGDVPIPHKGKSGYPWKNIWRFYKK